MLWERKKIWFFNGLTFVILFLILFNMFLSFLVSILLGFFLLRNSCKLRQSGLRIGHWCWWLETFSSFYGLLRLAVGGCSVAVVRDLFINRRAIGDLRQVVLWLLQLKLSFPELSSSWLPLMVTSILFCWRSHILFFFHRVKKVRINCFNFILCNLIFEVSFGEVSFGEVSFGEDNVFVFFNFLL
jgi:hypothetical protein